MREDGQPLVLRLWIVDRLLLFCFLLLAHGVVLLRPVHQVLNHHKQAHPARRYESLRSRKRNIDRVKPLSVSDEWMTSMPDSVTTLKLMSLRC